jgi:hypothetical protein
MTEAAVANDEFTAFWKRDGKVFMRSGSWAITASKPAKTSLLA